MGAVGGRVRSVPCLSREAVRRTERLRLLFVLFGGYVFGSTAGSVERAGLAI